MKIYINGDKSVLLERLQRVVEKPTPFVIFDIVNGPDSEIIGKYNADKYVVGFSRPLYFNPFKINLFDYEFKFTVDQLNDMLLLNGNVRLKRYVILILILLLGIICFNLYNPSPQKIETNWIFHLTVPTIICIYLAIEFFSFRKHIKETLRNIAKN